MSETNLFVVDDNVLPAVTKSFGKSEESLSEDVENVKNWIQQHHLPETMDEKTIRNFLLLNKCNLEKTKTKLENYYSVRSKLPCIFENSNPKSALMKQVSDGLYFVPLPKLTKNMSRVFIHRVRNKDIINDLHIYDVAGYAINVMEIRMKEDIAFKDVYIVDFKDLALRYCLKITPKVMYNMLVVIYQGVYSSRLEAMYFCNAPRIVEKLLGIIKFFIKPKLFERIHLCTEDSLKNVFSKNMLPKDLGGDEKSLYELQEMVAVKFLQYQNWFDQLDQMCVDMNSAKSENWNFWDSIFRSKPKTDDNSSK